MSEATIRVEDKPTEGGICQNAWLTLEQIPIKFQNAREGKIGDFLNKKIIQNLNGYQQG